MLPPSDTHDRAQVKLPFKVPGGVLAVAVGWAIAMLSGHLGFTWFTPNNAAVDDTTSPDLGTGGTADRFALPVFDARFLGMFLEPEFWQCLSVVIPMWLVNLVNNLANIEVRRRWRDRPRQHAHAAPHRPRKEPRTRPSPSHLAPPPLAMRRVRRRRLPWETRTRLGPACSAAP